jgi:hypothetical protein
VPEKAPDIAQLVGLVPVDRVVVFAKGFLETIGPDTIQLAEPFTDQAVKVGVGAFLRATLDNHVAQLNLFVSYNTAGHRGRLQKRYAPRDLPGY